MFEMIVSAYSFYISKHAPLGLKHIKAQIIIICFSISPSQGARLIFRKKMGNMGIFGVQIWEEYGSFRQFYGKNMGNMGGSELIS